MSTYRLVRPSDVRFTQDTVHSLFYDGRSINDTVSDIEMNYVNASEFLPIQVVQIERQLYTINNRSLYVFRVLQRRGVFKKINIEIIDEDMLGLRKCTTKNYGVSITLRKGHTLPHSFASTINRASTLKEDLRRLRSENNSCVTLDYHKDYDASDLVGIICAFSRF